MLRIGALPLALLLTGCGQSYVYMRADGQDISGDPALYKQFETDSMTCKGERHRYDASPTGRGASVGGSGVAVNDCMAEKGYIVVQSEVADLKRQDMAAKAAEKAQRDAAAAAPPAIEKLRSSTGGAAASRAAPAADALPVFEQCTRISDKAARLECFDRAAAKNSDGRRQ